MLITLRRVTEKLGGVFYIKTFRVCFSNVIRVKYHHSGSTIYALSSGYGKCGVAVIRVSGPHSSEALKKIGGFKELPEPRKVYLRKLRDEKSKEILDHGLVIWFPGPKSFTGEDCCELQIHGGSAVISAVLNSLANIKHFRPAEPGEFTKRAFYAGKLNLTEVEGLADLIHSETEIQRKQALIQMEGALSEVYSQWRLKLLQCVAHIEAFIDFSEDQHLEDNILEQVNKELELIKEKIEIHLADGRRGERLRNGVKTVILGAPNVGKSSLMNLLCQQPAAIVSSIPGTTRDVIKSVVDLCGFPVVLADTAGLRNCPSDIVEEEGITRARNAASDADLIILVVDVNDLLFWCKTHSLKIPEGFNAYIESYVTKLGIGDLTGCHHMHSLLTGRACGELHKGHKLCLVALNKSDLADHTDQLRILTDTYKSVNIISCKTEVGIKDFLHQLSYSLEQLCGSPSRENPSYTQARHRHCLMECLNHIVKYFTLSDSKIDIGAHDLRNALNSLGKITGHVTTEQILDIIFKDFCIGK